MKLYHDQKWCAVYTPLEVNSEHSDPTLWLGNLCATFNDNHKCKFRKWGISYLKWLGIGVISGWAFIAPSMEPAFNFMLFSLQLGSTSTSILSTTINRLLKRNNGLPFVNLILKSQIGGCIAILYGIGSPTVQH
ncbi:hypothetical protein VNO77_17138 [Canavalia gladiata]|uniref:Uncharacterized protein n=1 Tax=Canavalia gladiata TaxID=3824 RepID=A0AAN9LM71_CANGL